MGEVTPFKSHDATIADTPTFRAIGRLCRTCHDKLRLGIIIGGAGVGKTTGVEHDCANTPFAFYIRLPKSAGTQRSGMFHIYRSLGGTMELHRGGVQLYRALTDQIEAAVENKYSELIKQKRYHHDPRSRPLLCIDEAQNADFNLLTVLRDLFDERRIGLVLAGNADFRSMIYSPSGKIQFKPLIDRAIKPILEIPTATQEDVALIAASHRITGQRSIALLAKVAARYGLRTAFVDVVPQARDLAGSHNAIETSHIEHTVQLLGVDT